MQSTFKDQLPANVVSLVDELERFSGCEICVALEESTSSATGPNPDRMATRVNERGAVILTRSEGIFPPQGVLHELLHIQRYWVEAIPQVMPIDVGNRDRWSVTSSIENVLEHQIIVPREAEFGFEPFQYWNKTERKLWEQYPWPSLTIPWVRRKNLLLGWLSVVSLVNDANVRSLAEGCLKKEGLLAEAERFAGKIGKTIHDKPRAISTVLRFLKIPVNEVELVSFDVRAKLRRPVAIPNH